MNDQIESQDRPTLAERAVIYHHVVSDDFALGIPDPSNVQFLFADGAEVKIFFCLGEPRLLVLRFESQAKARRASNEITRTMERYHVAKD